MSLINDKERIKNILNPTISVVLFGIVASFYSMYVGIGTGESLFMAFGLAFIVPIVFNIALVAFWIIKIRDNT